MPFTPQLWLALIAPDQGAMATLSWPAWLDKYRDNADTNPTCKCYSPQN